MPTIVELTEQELAEIKALTKQDDAGAALRSAVAEYLRHARRMQLGCIPVSALAGFS